MTTLTALNIDVPAWIDQDITVDDVKAIQQGGCESGAYMPAVTYHQALETMNDHGDHVLEYLEGTYIELTPPAGAHWAGIAVYYISTAVELWASGFDDDELLTTKTVDYFGVEFEVPVSTTHLACDACGSLYAYDSEPPRSGTSWASWNFKGFTAIEHDQEGQPCPYWSESLVEV